MDEIHRKMRLFPRIFGLNQLDFLGIDFIITAVSLNFESVYRYNSLIERQHKKTPLVLDKQAYTQRYTQSSECNTKYYFIFLS